MTDVAATLREADPADSDTVLAALSTYNTALETAAAESDPPQRYRDLIWGYYQPFVELLDTAVQTEGWDVLEEALKQYNPSEDLSVPHCSHIVTNVVGRFIIRTRLRNGISTVPETALKYLRAFSGQYDHKIAQTESHTYGWGIGHPTHSMTAYLCEVVADKPWWVQQTLEHAFYADQQAAAELLWQLLTDDSITFTVHLAPGREVTKARFLLESLVGPDSEAYRPTVPRFWPKIDDYADFEWDSSIKDRLRTLVEETGLAEELPPEWTFQDLAF